MHPLLSLLRLFAAIFLLTGCKNSAFNSTGGIINPGASAALPAPVPFPVSVGGQPVIPAYPWCARIVDPVAKDATIRIPGVERATVSLYSCDAAGRTPSPNVRAIYNFRNKDSKSLADDPIGIAPTPGHYLARVESPGKPAFTFVFEVR